MYVCVVYVCVLCVYVCVVCVCCVYVCVVCARARRRTAPKMGTVYVLCVLCVACVVCACMCVVCVCVCACVRVCVLGGFLGQTAVVGSVINSERMRMDLQTSQT